MTKCVIIPIDENIIYDLFNFLTIKQSKTSHFLNTTLFLIFIGSIFIINQIVVLIILLIIGIFISMKLDNWFNSYKSNIYHNVSKLIVNVLQNKPIELYTDRLVWFCNDHDIEQVNVNATNESLCEVLLAKTALIPDNKKIKFICYVDTHLLCMPHFSVLTFYTFVLIMGLGFVPNVIALCVCLVTILPLLIAVIEIIEVHGVISLIIDGMVLEKPIPVVTFELECLCLKYNVPMFEHLESTDSPLHV